MFQILHFWLIGELNFFILDDVKFINVELASCPSNTGNNYFI